MTKRLRIIIAAAAPCAVLAVFALREYILGLSRYFPECTFLKATGYYCPGCGNTRSVRSMLQGHLWLAVRNNPTIPFLSLLLLLLYVEAVAGISGKQIKLLPRNGFFWGVVIAAFLAYYLLRNFIGVLAPVS